MWSAGVIAALVLSGAIGLSLGLVGGGGSTITVPILVYVAGLPVPRAVALSLAIVGVTAAVGAGVQAWKGNVHGKAAVLFGLTGAAGAVAGAKLTPLVPEPVLLLLFAALLLAVGSQMWGAEDAREVSGEAICRVRECGIAGLGIGVLTGFLGVGGGFLIVPALLRFARLPMRQAVGTSLLVIAANSASGLLAHVGALQGAAEVALAFTAVAVTGMFAGLALSSRVRPKGLKRAFGGLSLVIAGYLLVTNVQSLLDLINGKGG